MDIDETLEHASSSQEWYQPVRISQTAAPLAKTVVIVAKFQSKGGRCVDPWCNFQSPECQEMEEEAGLISWL